MPFEQFPYTNFHELNLEWVISTVKTMQNEIDSVISDAEAVVENASEYAEQSKQSAIDSKDFADDSKDSADDAKLSEQNTANYLASVISYYNSILTLTGSPLVAALAADMTNTNKVYVYVGSEVGMNYGHWYYYNGSVWTDGGVYNSAAVNTDETLSVSGSPADAAVTGERIQDLLDNMFAEELIPPIKSTAHPTGYNDSYIQGSVGNTWSNSNSVYYMRLWYRLNETNYPQLKNCAYLMIQPYTGYSVRLHEVDPDTNIITNIYGQINTNTYPEYAGLPLYVKFDPSKDYLASFGRFNNGDAAAFVADEDFLSNFKIYAVYNFENKKKNLPKTGKYEWFNIEVDRPITCGGTDTLTGTETIECVMMLPSTYSTNGKPTRMIMACHGESGYIDKANDTWYNSSWVAFMEDLVAAGYGVFDCNMYSDNENASIRGKGYGSPAYINNLKRTYDYIVDNYNVYPQIFVHGTSMGGVSATAFSNLYPELVLAESGFAGRDIFRVVNEIKENSDSTMVANICKAFGYNDLTELTNDQWSTIAGCYPALNLVKIENGHITIQPDRSTDFNNWLTYVTEIDGYTLSDTPATFIGKRLVPYKAWNSKNDNINHFMAERVLTKAYNLISNCPYYTVEYDTYTHTQLSYGTVDNMRDQLIAWFKRWE